jgi:minichromosome maintenance protein 10
MNVCLPSRTGIEEPQWPPRSPLEALLSSPSARKRVKLRYDRTSPSPISFAKSTKTAATPPILHKLNYKSLSSEEEDEDEETLQIRLEALEAKLKLKRLQAKKAKQAFVNSAHELDEEKLPARTGSVLSSRRDIAQQSCESSRAKSSNAIQVPLSPEKRRVVSQEARSPGRVVLGIDKGLRGKNISLRRAPSQKLGTTGESDPFTDIPQHSQVKLSGSPLFTAPAHGSGQKSFSQRMAESREQEKYLKLRKKTVDELRSKRSTGFGLAQKEIEALRTLSETQTRTVSATGRADQGDKTFSRNEVVRASSKPSSSLVRRTETALGAFKTRLHTQSSTDSLVEAPKRLVHTTAQRRVPVRNTDPKEAREQPGDISGHPMTSATDSENYEPYSSTNLSRRILPHTFLTRTMDSKTHVLISSLLRDIKAPDFAIPASLEALDMVVFGIIASKSSPLSHKGARVHPKDSSTSSVSEAAASETNACGKYMVFTLTDMTWTLDLYLFNTAYTRFWKLMPGTVIAILNPDVMPPPPGKVDTGRWSLVLNSSDDTILEIGTASDLGFCKATRKDGKLCSSWVDLRKTEYCEWHIDQQVERCRRGRMEVQGMSAPFGPGGKRGGNMGFFGGRRKNFEKNGNQDGLLKEGAQYDQDTRSAYFIAPSLGRGSASALLDADEISTTRGGSREDLLRKRLAAKEKEKEIAKRLAEIGNGTGAEYLRLRHGGERDGRDHQNGDENSVDAGALGLLDNKARNVHLSPLKRKGSETWTTSRKKTRFVTARGIKEAGRESLGAVQGADSENGVTIDTKPTDEDELDIV